VAEVISSTICGHRESNNVRTLPFSLLIREAVRRGSGAVGDGVE